MPTTANKQATYASRKAPTEPANSKRTLLLIPLALSPIVLLGLLSGNNEWTIFVGHFHPMAVHLPIGILLLTAFMESLGMVSRGRIQFASRMPLFLGALTAVAAMVLGLLLDKGESMAGVLLNEHLRWGIATAVLSIAALGIRCLPTYTTGAIWPVLYRATLLLTCGVLIWASHLGAAITHGETYLSGHLPWRHVSTEKVTVTDDNLTYEHAIVPIFEAKCNSCHKAAYNKGELIMDSYAGLLDGGLSGPGIVPGDVASSLVISRVVLPLADDKHMPPAKKPQMTPEELAIVTQWIRQGAPRQPLE